MSLIADTQTTREARSHYLKDVNKKLEIILESCRKGEEELMHVQIGHFD